MSLPLSSRKATRWIAGSKSRTRRQDYSRLFLRRRRRKFLSPICTYYDDPESPDTGSQSSITPAAHASFSSPFCQKRCWNENSRRRVSRSDIYFTTTTRILFFIYFTITIISSPSSLSFPSFSFFSKCSSGVCMCRLNINPSDRKKTGDHAADREILQAKCSSPAAGYVTTESPACLCAKQTKKKRAMRRRGDDTIQLFIHISRPPFAILLLDDPSVSVDNWSVGQ